jgi:predicted metal-dependent hydrolase
LQAFGIRQAATRAAGDIVSPTAGASIAGREFWPPGAPPPIIPTDIGAARNRAGRSAAALELQDRMSDDEPSIEALYAEGIRHFNACDFFEAHEVWEELWTEYRGPARRFYQGLIQAAVALHHFGNGNIRGAKKVYESSRAYLNDYCPAYLGLNLDQFLAQYERCFADVLASTEEFPRIDVDPEQIPEIHLEEGVSQ